MFAPSVAAFYFGLLGAAAWAATDRCVNPKLYPTTKDFEICLQGEANDLQGSLDAAMKRALSHSDKEHADFLIKTQKAWQEYSNAECETQGDMMRHGTGDLEQQGICEVEKLQGRISEVENDFDPSGIYGDSE